jgi:hypothetical protein
MSLPLSDESLGPSAAVPCPLPVIGGVSPPWSSVVLIIISGRCLQQACAIATARDTGDGRGLLSAGTYLKVEEYASRRAVCPGV